MEQQKNCYPTLYAECSVCGVQLNKQKAVQFDGNSYCLYCAHGLFPKWCPGCDHGGLGKGC